MVLNFYQSCNLKNSRKFYQTMFFITEENMVLPILILKQIQRAALHNSCAENAFLLFFILFISPSSCHGSEVMNN